MNSRDWFRRGTELYSFSCCEIVVQCVDGRREIDKLQFVSHTTSSARRICFCFDMLFATRVPTCVSERPVSARGRKILLSGVGWMNFNSLSTTHPAKMKHAMQLPFP